MDQVYLGGTNSMDRLRIRYYRAMDCWLRFSGSVGVSADYFTKLLGPELPNLTAFCALDSAEPSSGFHPLFLFICRRAHPCLLDCIVFPGIEV